ncbi:hypothetical protein P9990_19800 [Prescottella equi]|uniref:hypothetical protein n=1 Tax=Rhodococcus hoagii TaxID=43767 RepID=UPI002578B041|nr:hypothetical protein [Prescottella equi]WJJ10799.1 hypothetical protein P9990_19800 [Prescottella equi]
MTTNTAVLELPWTKPPLSMNDRMHWAQKAKLTKRIRSTARTLAAAKRLPAGLDHVSVALVYRPRDRRRRDTDNLMPVLKALCDGLVDHGLVTDDTPQWMTKHMPRLDEPQKGAGGAMWLELTWEGANGENDRSQPEQPAATNTKDQR